jgi:hypothetical protein
MGFVRDLIYIELSLPSNTWLKSNIIEHEIIDYYLRDSIQEEDESLINQPYEIELIKLLRLYTQAKKN